MCGFNNSRPPYFEIVKNSWDNQWKTEDDYINWCINWSKECFRILKPNGLFYIWGAVGKHKKHPFIKYMIKLEETTDFNFINWITMRNFRVFGNSKHFPFARQELLVYGKNNNFTYNKQYSDFEGVNRLGNPKLITNVWLDCKDVSLYNKKISHPTEKPQLSSDRIVLSSSKENDLVYIPFAGSGVDIESCIKNNRNWIATETNREYIEEIINKRIDNTYKELNKEAI